MWSIDPSDAVPIWRQIEDGVRYRVAVGALRPGDPVPSVRELARELRVNPLTVSKAYQRLAGDGVVEVRRGQGTFVAASPPRMSAAARRARLAESAGRHVALGRSLGADRAETTGAVERAWDEIAEGEG